MSFNMLTFSRLNNRRLNKMQRAEGTTRENHICAVYCRRGRRLHISGDLGNEKKREARRVTAVVSRAADRVFLLLTHLAVADGTGKVMDTPSFVKSTEHCNKSERVALKMFLLTEKYVEKLNIHILCKTLTHIHICTFSLQFYPGHADCRYIALSQSPTIITKPDHNNRNNSLSKLILSNQ